MHWHKSAFCAANSWRNQRKLIIEIPLCLMGNLVAMIWFAATTKVFLHSVNSNRSSHSHVVRLINDCIWWYFLDCDHIYKKKLAPQKKKQPRTNTHLVHQQPQPRHWIPHPAEDQPILSLSNPSGKTSKIKFYNIHTQHEETQFFHRLPPLLIHALPTQIQSWPSWFMQFFSLPPKFQW